MGFLRLPPSLKGEVGEQLALRIDNKLLSRAKRGRQIQLSSSRTLRRGTSKGSVVDSSGKVRIRLARDPHGEASCAHNHVGPKKISAEINRALA